MTSKHTPGPWRLETVPTSIGQCHKIGPFPGGHDCCVYDDGRPVGTAAHSPELLADARLIAASPELLAACEIALEESRRLNRHGHGLSANTEIRLRAAIAAAKGQS